MADEKFTAAQQKDKIAKLLRKAEGTDNVHEQQAFTEQAERMMLRLGVTLAELQFTGVEQAPAIITETRDYGTIYGQPMVSCMFQVSLGFGNLEFFKAHLRGDFYRIHIIGVRSDVEQFMELVDSLYLQVPAALKRWVRENRDEMRLATANEKWVAKRSFIQGYAATVRNRLHEMRKEVEQEASPGAALVLVDKGARVEKFMEQNHPNLVRSRGTRSHDFDAHLAGRRAGAEANLGGSASLPGARPALR